MAIHSSTLNWANINSTTDRVLSHRIKDQIFKSNAFFTKCPKDSVDGGAWLAEPVFYAEGPGGSYSGTEALDASEVEQVTNAIFPWKFYWAGAAIRNQDILMNSGRKGVIKLVNVKNQIMRLSMQNRLGQGLYSDGSIASAITGLGAMVTGSGTIYGGISKTTNAWWRANVDSSTATLTLAHMRTQMGNASQEGISKPNLILGRQVQYNRFWVLLQPQERFINASMASAGFTNLSFEGVPFVVDSHVPDNYIYYLTTKYMSFKYHSAENMKIVGWRSPVEKPQLKINHMLWAGNLCGSNCRFQAVSTAIAA